jgi:hypothetical protein
MHTALQPQKKKEHERNHLLAFTKDILLVWSVFTQVSALVHSLFTF